MNISSYLLVNTRKPSINSVITIVSNGQSVPQRHLRSPAMKTKQIHQPTNVCRLQSHPAIQSCLLLQFWKWRHLDTRQHSYRKEDRAMRPIYGCPENFWESSLRTRLLFPKFVMGFCSDLYTKNVRTKFEGQSRDSPNFWSTPYYLRNG